MRCCALLALCATQHAVPATAPAAPRGALGRALMHAGLVDPVERFAGSIYGVHARVHLNMRTRVATVSLRGAVIGGTVQGTGWLTNPEAEAGGVVLEERFAARLRRRFVRVESAALDRTRRTVTVRAAVPILGVVDIVLTQQED
jgi:hypothetical protein